MNDEWEELFEMKGDGPSLNKTNSMAFSPRANYTD
jgi:hypothetical protein